MRPVLSDIQNIIVTSSIAFVTGYVFKIFGLPAPFLLGSLFGVWIIAGIIQPIRWHSALGSCAGNSWAWHSHWR